MKVFMAILLCVLLYGCGNNSSRFSIQPEPVYEHIHDLNYWNVQYFDIKGYHSISDSILMEKIIEFSEKELFSRNIIPPNINVQNFYDKKWYRIRCNSYSNFRDEVINGDAQLPKGCGDLLVCDIHYHRADTIQKTYTRNITIFVGDGFSFRNDSLKVEKGKWILLKKGKINKDNRTL